MDETGKRKLKLTILGGNKAGKTALTVRFLTGKFIFEYASGHDIVYQHNFLVASTQVPLQITDTSCNENVADAVDGSDGMVIVYAIDNEKSFQKAKQILSDVTKTDGKESCVALVANKSDLWQHKSVERADGKELAEKYHCKYFEMSALSCKDGVLDMFNCVIHLAVEKTKMRSLSLPAQPTKPLVVHDEIKRSNSLQFTKKDLKAHKTKTLTKSVSLMSNIASHHPSPSKHSTNNKSKNSHSHLGSMMFGSKHNINNNNNNNNNNKNNNADSYNAHNNISRLLQKYAIGDMDNISTDTKQSGKNKKILQKTLGDMGHIAFSAIAFPMMNPMELKT